MHPNAIMPQDAYPLPCIDESMNAFACSRYFSTLDDQWVLAKLLRRRRPGEILIRHPLWPLKVEGAAFEMTSSLANFKHMMDQVLYGFNWKTLLLHLGDVIVIFLNFDSHLQRLDKPFKRLQDAGLKLKPTKCKLLKDEVYYLGCVMSAKSVASDPAKVQDFQR